MSENNKEKKTEEKKDINKIRDIYLCGGVKEEIAKKVVESIFEINRHDKKKANGRDPIEPIRLIIDSFGGSLYSANMIIGAIETSDTPIHTYCYGKAMSAGLYIFASGHMRYATPLATFMYHDGSVAMSETIEGLVHDLDHQINLRNKYDEYILSVTNLPRKLLDDSKAFKRDLCLFATEALKYGLVDEIIWHRERNRGN